MSKELKKILLSPPILGSLEKSFVEEALSSNWIAPLGPQVNKFEEEMAELIGSKRALALASGTAAIHLALRLLEVERGDVVFCSSFTFVASANPILYQGAEVVFIDSEPESWNMSPEALRKAFQHAVQKNKLPKAVIVVNMFGQSADYDPLSEICADYDVPIIEDAAESLGATYKGKQSGSLGDFGVFSFNGNKIITTSGGGMLISNQEAQIDRAHYLATQAREDALHYQHSELGYNYRLSNILAAIGRGQLRQLEERVAKKRTIFHYYEQQLSQITGLQLMPEADFGRSTRWLTTLTIDPHLQPISPTELVHRLAKKNIEARRLWKPLHLQPLYENALFFAHEEEEAIANKLFEQGICLPSGVDLSRQDQDMIVAALQQIFH